MEPTKEELAFIKKLQKLMDKCPDSLYLNSDTGTLWVMKYGIDGFPAESSDGGLDPEYAISSIRGIRSYGAQF